MSITLQYKNTNYLCEIIIWDRDSYFIDFNNYWARLAGTIAQKIAENTTDNWNKFNLVRTQSIKALGINPESGLPELLSPINILPVDIFHFILASNLRDILSDKKLNELNTLFKSLITKATEETRKYIKDSIIIKNLEIIKSINKKAKQIIITNDFGGNNELFLREINLDTCLFKNIAQINKERLDDLLNKNSIFITNNIFLKDSYLKRNILNVLSIEDINMISFKESNVDLVTINIDGASKGNPGPASIGIVFYKNKDIIQEVSEYIGNKTNNFAEYTSLIRALEISLNNSYKDIEIKSDSELVVKQINKIYKVKDADIKELFDKVNSLIEKFSSVKISHIPREENLKADKLANNALKQNHL